MLGTIGQWLLYNMQFQGLQKGGGKRWGDSKAMLRGGWPRGAPYIGLYIIDTILGMAWQLYIQGIGIIGRYGCQEDQQDSGGGLELVRLLSRTSLGGIMYIYQLGEQEGGQEGQGQGGQGGQEGQAGNQGGQIIGQGCCQAVLSMASAGLLGALSICRDSNYNHIAQILNIMEEPRRKQKELFGDEVRIEKRLRKEEEKEQIVTQETEAINEYDLKPEIDRVIRQQQRTFQLKILNNWVKSVLIQKYCQLYSKQQALRGGLAVMDIGCGKGGDLQKWAANAIKRYVGLDISTVSLIQAQTRFNKLQADLKKQRIKGEFLEMNLGTSNFHFSQYVQEKFDLISCQFCLHYLFENEEMANNAFHNISDKLLDQGFVLITIPDANVLIRRLREKYPDAPLQDKYEIGNKYYSIQFSSLRFERNSPFGIKYNFYLEDGVGEKQIINDSTSKVNYVPEYLVETSTLIKLAAKYGLELVERQNFINFFSAEKGKSVNSFLFQTFDDKFFQNDSAMEKDLWDISNIYQIVVFQKNDHGARFKLDRSFKSIATKYQPTFTTNQ